MSNMYELPHTKLELYFLNINIIKGSPCNQFHLLLFRPQLH